MKRIAFFLLLALVFTSCEKDPDTGDLLIIFEYDGDKQENTKCTLYSSYDNYFYEVNPQQQISDGYGEVFYPELEPGWYYFEAEKEFSSMFSVYVLLDSIKVEPLQETSKISVLYANN
jgi:hypothetical protein